MLKLQMFSICFKDIFHTVGLTESSYTSKAQQNFLLWKLSSHYKNQDIQTLFQPMNA